MFSFQITYWISNSCCVAKCLFSC